MHCGPASMLIFGEEHLSLTFVTHASVGNVNHVDVRTKAACACTCVCEHETKRERVPI